MGCSILTAVPQATIRADCGLKKSPPMAFLLLLLPWTGDIRKAAACHFLAIRLERRRRHAAPTLPKTTTAAAASFLAFQIP